jgi:hypothetical protein
MRKMCIQIDPDKAQIGDVWEFKLVTKRHDLKIPGSRGQIEKATNKLKKVTNKLKKPHPK